MADGPTVSCRADVAIVHLARRAIATPGTGITAGDEVQVPSGSSAVIDWHDGAVIQLAGGTRVRLGGAPASTEPVACELLAGTLHARISHRAHPFTIQADWATVRDLGTEFSVRRADSDVVVGVDEGSVALERGGRSITVRAGRLGDAPKDGRPWQASVVPLALPVGTGAWRAVAASGVADNQLLAIDPQSWHAEPLGICAVPAAAGNAVAVSDAAGTVLGQVPLPSLADSAEALEGLEALVVVGDRQAWLLRQPRLAADGSLHAAALVDCAPGSGRPAFGGLFAPSTSRSPTRPPRLRHPRTPWRSRCPRTCSTPATWRSATAWSRSAARLAAARWRRRSWAAPRPGWWWSPPPTSRPCCTIAAWLRPSGRSWVPRCAMSPPAGWRG